MALSELDLRWPELNLPLVTGQKDEGAVIPSQNARNCATRLSGALPAMMAALIAPIEIPASQSGRYGDFDSAS
jgi:hypothetical protein